MRGVISGPQGQCIALNTNLLVKRISNLSLAGTLAERSNLQSVEVKEGGPHPFIKASHDIGGRLWLHPCIQPQPDSSNIHRGQPTNPGKRLSAAPQGVSWHWTMTAHEVRWSMHHLGWRVKRVQGCDCWGGVLERGVAKRGKVGTYRGGT